MSRFKGLCTNPTQRVNAAIGTNGTSIFTHTHTQTQTQTNTKFGLTVHDSTDKMPVHRPVLKAPHSLHGFPYSNKPQNDSRDFPGQLSYVSYWCFLNKNSTCIPCFIIYTPQVSQFIVFLNDVIPLCTYYIMLYYIFPSTQLQVIQITATCFDFNQSSFRRAYEPKRAKANCN